MPNVCNWWCKIGPVDYDDIDTIHEILAYTKKNKTFDPTLSSYVPNPQKGIKYGIGTPERGPPFEDTPYWRAGAGAGHLH